MDIVASGSLSLSACGGRRPHESNEVVQALAVLPLQDMKVGDRALHKIAFVRPVTDAKDSRARQQIDGVLPTSLFARVFISYADRFAVLDPR